MGHLKIRELNREVVTRFVSWIEDQRMSDGRAYSDSSLKSVYRVARGFSELHRLWDLLVDIEHQAVSV